MTSNPKTEVETLQPFVAYLASRLATSGIEGGRVTTTRTPDEMAALMHIAAVDLYLDSPFAAALVRHRSRARPLLRQWRNGEAASQSVIFARVDSGIDVLDDLAGRHLAVESPHSTTGYFLPRTALFEAGYELVHRVRPTARVNSREVGLVVTTDDESTMAWVLRGRTAAGAMDRRVFVEYGGSRLNELKIVWESEEVPRHLVMVRPDLDADLVAALEETLIGMENDDEGSRVLRQFENTTRFDRLPMPPESLFRPLLDAFALQNGVRPPPPGCPPHRPGACQ